MADLHPVQHSGALRKAAIITSVIAVGMFFIGLLLLIVTYASGAAYPIPGIGNANLLVAGLILLPSVPVGIVAVVLWIMLVARKK